MVDQVAAVAGQAIAGLEVTRRLATDLAAVRRGLADPGWLGQIAAGPPDRPDLRRVQTDLAFTLRDDAQ